jgi:hypothetical protein
MVAEVVVEGDEEVEVVGHVSAMVIEERPPA